jgi:GTP pyrophosphokinase
MYIFPQCCHPIPGDDILGYIDNKNHVEIHKRNCPVASRLKSSFGNRILDAKWVMHNQILFDATIQIRGIDRKGILHDLADIISDKLDTSIHRITVTSDDGIFEGKIELRVHDRNEMPTIIQQLKDIEGLQEVQQIL